MIVDSRILVILNSSNMKGAYIAASCAGILASHTEYPASMDTEMMSGVSTSPSAHPAFAELVTAKMKSTRATTHCTE